MSETTPYRRDFSPEAEDRTAAHRDSLPYCELAIVPECQADRPTDRPAMQPEKALAISLDGTTERDLPPPPELFAESSDVWTVKREKAETSKVSTLQRPKPGSSSASTIERPEPESTNVSTSVSTRERPKPGSSGTSTLERPRPGSSDVSTRRRPQPETRKVASLSREVESARVSTVDITAPCAKGDDELAVTAERTRFGRGSGAQPKHGAASGQPAREDAGAQQRRTITSATVDDKPPRVAGALSWLGVVVAQPEVGAPLVIGTWLCPEFRVTSPVAKIVERDDGVLVQTVTKSRYFVKPAGDAYLVGSAGKSGKAG